MADLVYTAYRTTVVRREFRCGGCGFASAVEITAKGAGQVVSSGLAKNPDAAASAVRGASAGAERWAEVHLELCPCPKCGWRNPVYTVPFKRKSWIIGAVSAGLFVAGSALAVLFGLFLAGIVAFFGLIGLLVTPPLMLSIWAAPKKQVRFLISQEGAGKIAPG